MKLIDDPDERFWYPPAACSGCGTDLAAEPVTAQRRHQVTSRGNNDLRYTSPVGQSM